MNPILKTIHTSLVCSILLLTAPARAQITPDTTLGNEASRLTPNQVINGASADRIDGGAQRGINLFHSFSQFNIGDGQRLYFSNPVGVQNILTRVTGAGASNILGTLGVDGAANLFLINPNGILFGQNARLDVRGSFVGTTANGVKFGDLGVFDVADKQAPGLLTVNPSALLFNQINQGASIQIQGAGLQVPESKSLLLVGANISIDNGILYAPGGQIELASLADVGSVELQHNNILKLNFLSQVQRADVSLNNSLVYVADKGEGDVVINARKIDILGKSVIIAGINDDLAPNDSKAGNLSFNATSEIKIGQESIIANALFDNANGQSGDINIDTGSFLVSDNAQLLSFTEGRGNTGDINIKASKNILFDNAYASNRNRIQAIGNGGNIYIESKRLTLRNGSALDTIISGVGNGGNINIKIDESILLDNAFIDTAASVSALGNNGNINISTRSLSVINKSVLTTRISGQALSAGNVTINARESILLDNAFIDTVASASAFGNSGNISINTHTLSVINKSLLTTTSYGRDDAGNVNINSIDSVSFDDSYIKTDTQSSSDGKSGNITANTKLLSLTNGAQWSTNTFGKGNAGNLRIVGRDRVNVSGNNLTTGLSSGLFAVSKGNADGDSGSINIDANLLSISEGAVIDARTENAGKGGSVTVNGDFVELKKGGQIITTSTSRGSAGKIEVNAFAQMSVDGIDTTYENRRSKIGQDSFINTSEESGLFVRSTGQGDAGDIQVTTPIIKLDNGAKFNAESKAVDGGNIDIKSDLLLLRRNSSISATAGLDSGAGNGGNIKINAGAIVAVPRENSDIRANAFKGRGGNVTINTNALLGIAASPIETFESNITASSEAGIQGEISITEPEVQPAQGLIELPEEVVDATRQVVQICPRQPGAKPLGEFTITGRGSLPPSPLEPLTGATNQQVLATLEQENSNSKAPVSLINNSPAPQIAEAQGWVKTSDGGVELVAKAPSITSKSTATTTNCPVVQ